MADVVDMGKWKEERQKSRNDIEEIIEKYQGKAGGKFEDRIAAYEDFQTNAQDRLRIQNHAHDIVMGGSSGKGAYHAALEAHSNLKEDNGKVTDVDKLTEMMEKYVDTTLHQVHPEYGKWIASQEKDLKEKGFKGKELTEQLRKIKGNAFALYHPTGDERGTRINPLAEEYISGIFKGKSKEEIKARLSQVADETKKAHSQYLFQRATDGLIKRDDLFDLNPHVAKKLEHAGYKSEDHPNTWDFGQTLSTYRALLSNEPLDKLGYKPVQQDKKAA